MQTPIRCVIHGSFGKHFAEIQRVRELFEAAGVEVLAPKASELIHVRDGFALFEDEQDMDPRLVELHYLHKLRALGASGFSYFVNPDGYIGKSTSYELGIAQLTNVRCFFSEAPTDHPAYIHQNSVWSAENLAHYLATTGKLPPVMIQPDEKAIHALWQRLILPGSVVAVGAIIERAVHDKHEVLLVKTHKWGGRYSMVGGKVRRGERLQDALLREVKEETGLKGIVGEHLATFDQIRDSGYYKPTQHIFVDNIVRTTGKKVTLNDEAQDYLWVPADEALTSLDIEPNARHTVEMYVKHTSMQV